MGSEPASPAEIAKSVAGGSAQREADRRRSRRAAKVRKAHPHVGGFILAVTDEPQSTRAWSEGAEGERRLGAGLDRLGTKGVQTLHDRRRPGTSANLDHLAVCAGGVWVIDAKYYKGRVELRDVGGWFSKDRRLFVGGRDRSNLVGGLAVQREAILAALGPELSADLPVHTALCFVDGDWRWFAKPFSLGGSLICWPKALYERLSAPGPLAEDKRSAILAALAAVLPPA